MKIIQDNPVELFLKKNPNKIYSLKKLKYNLKLSKKHLYFLAMNSKKIKKIKPSFVGSNKHNLSIFKYNNTPDVVCNIKIVNEMDNIVDINSTNETLNEKELSKENILSDEELIETKHCKENTLSNKELIETTECKENNLSDVEFIEKKECEEDNLSDGELIENSE